LPPCRAGDGKKKKLIVVLPFDKLNEFAGVPLTVKSLAWTVAGSAGSLRLTVNSVGAYPTMLPQAGLVTEQPMGVAVAVAVGVAVGVEVGVGVGVGLGAAAQYLPPVLKKSVLSPPPQTIISLPVQTAVCQ
jgi:hypothetical protein